ncbi:MAG TPA: beta-propeller domain-containing protein, partial [Labilithrix sp.]|nr:beta-propeller domain-containing protein [Labilithrix sp.]
MRPHLLSWPSSQYLAVVTLAASLPFAYGCSDSLFGGGDGERSCAGSSALDVIEPEPGGIHGFASEQDLDTYIASIEARQRKETGGGGSHPCSGAAQNSASADNASDDAAGAAPAASEGASNEEITNNQESGVDEGGIVKNVGSQLVVLRKGRLFAVDVGEGHAPALTDSIRVARTPALNSSVWYDEMLVKGDLVYVVGYRYGIPNAAVRGATEIDTFRLAGGKLTRLKSMFLESNDYYSGHNYASRMVDGKLLFYMPHYIGRREGKLQYPQVLEANDEGVFTTVGPIFGALDVKTSLYKPLYPAFHTVVQCELPDTGELSCHGRSVIGSWWRETYVSPSAVYLWASSHVYRFDFASLGVTSHGADGYPLDQFSFKETDKSLLVAVGGPSSAGASGARVLSLPLTAFDTTGGQTVQSTSLGGVGLEKNRFVGDVLVASLYSLNAKDHTSGPSELVSFDSATGTIARSEPGARVQRIEPLGDRRVLVVRADRPYQATSLEL